MPIPTSIRAIHVIQALAALDQGEPHHFGEPTRYELHHNGRRYPPKAVIGIAGRFATGEELRPGDFSSGEQRSQAVGYLRALGFTVLPITEAGHRNLLLYWKPETADHEQAHSGVLDHAASEQLARVTLGDTIWVVTVRSGHLFLIGRLHVDEITDHAEAVRRRPDVWEASLHVFPESPEPYQNLDITDIAASLRFEGKADRLALQDGMVNAQQLQTMRNLTEDSVHLLGNRWGGAPRMREAGQGYVADSELRRAIEQRAMEAATEHYRSLGYTVEDKSMTECFDLRCWKGNEEVRVEVKGSQGEGAEVFLTAGEVEHARSCPVRIDLFVWGWIDAEEKTATGGRLSRRIENWKPKADDLTPVQYRYRVPLT